MVNTRFLAWVVGFALVAAACGGGGSAATTGASVTTTIPPTTAAPPTTTLPPTTTTTLPPTTTTTTLPPPEVAWGVPDAIASLGSEFLIVAEGKTSQISVPVITSWGDSAYAFTQVDVLGRSHDLGGLLQTDSYSDVGVWASPDGSAWEERGDLPFPGFFDEWAQAATTFNGDLVVVGSWRQSGTEPTQVQNIWTFPTDDLDGAVWFGDGVTGEWTRIDDPDLGGDRDEEIFDVFTVGGILVAVGSADVLPQFGSAVMPIFDAAVWTSTDGREWVRVPDADGFFSGPGISTAFNAAVTDGITATVLGVDQGGAVDELAVWTTGDGSQWQRVEISGDGISTGQDLVVADAALSPAGMVVVGSEFGSAGRFPAAWFSSDGVAWERVFPGIDSEGELVSVAATESGFVAVGHARQDGNTTPLVVLSGDGRGWHEDTSGSFEVEGGIRAVLTAVGVHNGMPIAAGMVTYFDDSRDVMIWGGSIGPLGR